MDGYQAGFIYLRYDPDKRLYCFGKARDISKRNPAYRKPNPDILTPIDSFPTNDMVAAENELIHRVERQFLRVPRRNYGKEWAKGTPEFLEVWELVKERHRWRPAQGGSCQQQSKQLSLFS